MLAWLKWIVLVSVMGTGISFAQTALQEVPQGPSTASALLTLDQERLFKESDYGRAQAAWLAQVSEALAADNRRIEAELIVEERALTEQRPKMTPEAFRVAADAFDAKVVEIRRAQDGKSQDLTAVRDTSRQRFFAAAEGELQNLANARGAVAVIDARTVLVSSASIEITDELIATMNGLGDLRFEAPAP